jgi:outer membrane protein insertion porin family
MRAARPWLWLLCMGWAVGLLASVASAAEKPAAAKIRVRGLGWIQNREMRLGIERLWGERPPAVLNTNQIEDAALFLAANLAPQGFLKPAVGVEARLEDGTVEKFAIDLQMETTPPRWLRANQVTFQVERGLRYFIDDVRIDGLRTVPKETALGFFYSDVALITGKAARAYSPAKVQRGAGAIESTLEQQGFYEAEVTTAEPDLGNKTGAVQVALEVKEGPRWIVADVHVHVEGQELTELQLLKKRVGAAWSTYLSQDIGHEVRNAYFKQGYPDVRVQVEPRPREEKDGVRQVDVAVRIASGGHVAIGNVQFRGYERTRPQVMARRVRLATGDSLNPAAVERARYRLGRLGIFKTVEIDYDPDAGPVRDVIFDLKEEKRLEMHLMAGYGSYERLRGGIEVSQRNLWGRAHRSRLELVQSMKSSRGEYTYSVPEIFGEAVDGSAKLFGLQREERAFLRQEYGGTFTLTRPLPWLKAEGSLGYTFQALQNRDNELSTREEDERAVPVASIDIGLTRDARDNPLRPRRGYRWYLQSELAATYLGGELNYQRVEFGGSYHTAWGRGRWIHVGLSHGVVPTLGSSDRMLPVNKRFYPGGESSIRGFGEGEASPRGPDQRYIGAKSFTLLNFEVEQAVVKSWSLVLFTDVLGSTATLRSYPVDETLISVGLGIRYQTLIGPLRVEYGHNVKKRDFDPSGTLHLSVGFPF